MNSAPVWQLTPPMFFEGPLQDTVQADVAIVGGGLTGLSTAYHLCAGRPGLQVVVLEAGHVGGGASGRSTGMLGPGVGQNLLGLVARLGDAGAEAVYRQTLHAITLVQELIAAEGIPCDLSMGGQIHWARSVAGRRRLAAQAAWLHGYGLPVETQDDDALQAYVRLPQTPGRGRGLPAALRLPVAGVLDPGKLVAGLAHAAHRRGARILESSPVSALDAGTRERKVALSLAGGGKVLARRVVVATAGYTDRLGWLPGRIIPMQLQALATEPLPAEVLNTIGWHRREGIVEARRIFNYFRLTADNRLVFGGGAPRSASPGKREMETLPRNVQRALADSLFLTFPELADQGIRITHGWSGMIGYVVNGMPVIGRSRDHPDILHAVGWSGHGVALGVAAGRWLADLISQGDASSESAEALALFDAYPPKVPCRRLHGLAIRSSVGAMGLMDRIDRSR